MHRIVYDWNTWLKSYHAHTSPWFSPTLFFSRLTSAKSIDYINYYRTMTLNWERNCNLSELSKNVRKHILGFPVWGVRTLGATWESGLVQPVCILRSSQGSPVHVSPIRRGQDLRFLLYDCDITSRMISSVRSRCNRSSTGELYDW